MASNIPVIVQGNSFSLAIPLQIYYINGDQMDLEDYIPDPTDEISIQLKGERRQYTYTPTVDGNICNIDLSGNELAGNYSVVVSIVKASGQRLRSFRTDQFFIVESSDDLTPADIIEGLEENVIYLNSSIFVAGEDGRGITSIVKTATAGLVDTYTITYSDNTTSTFQVTNGAQGEAGATIASVEKTATVGKVDTYTITMTDGNTFNFEVTNGLDGVDLGLANIVNDLTTGGPTNVLSAEMGKQLGEDLDALDFTGADVVSLSSAKIEITTDNDDYITHIDSDGVHAKDFLIQDVDDAVSPRSIKDELDAISVNVINGDANIMLETPKVTILNSQDVEIGSIDDNGIHSPTIKEDYPRYDAYIIPSYGQSLAIGTQGGSTTFASVEPMAYNENLTKTGIIDMCQGIAEGFRLVKEANNIVLPSRTKIITFAIGTGGISAKNLSKGGTYGYTQLLASITTAKQNCDANGLTCCVPCIGWTQGEEDMRCGGNPALYGTTGYEPTEYHNTLITLINDLNTDIKAITGQKEDVVFVTYQTSSHTSYKRFPRIALEQSLADELSDKIYLVKPNYNVEYKREGSSSDPGTSGLTGFEVHCPNKSYREMGNHYGIACAEIVLLNKKPSRCYPTSFFANGNKMVIRFNVPVTPIVLDTTNVNNLPDGNYGFCVYDVNEGIGETGSIAKATTAITDVEVTDIDEVTITFSRTPQTGEVLTYGVNGDYWVNIDGVSDNRTDYEVDDGITKSGYLHGSRGCLRDSSPLTNNNTGAIYTNMYNWCRYFEFEF